MQTNRKDSMRGLFAMYVVAECANFTGASGGFDLRIRLHLLGYDFKRHVTGDITLAKVWEIGFLRNLRH